MLIQIDTCKISAEALVAIAETINDSRTLYRFREIATEDINIAIINNPCAPKHLRHIIFDDVKDCKHAEKYLEHFCKNPISHDTISLILTNFPDCIHRYGELLAQEDATIEDLNILFEGIIRNNVYKKQALLTKIINHDNVDAALLTKIAQVSDELREKVLEREGVTITIHFNKQEE